MFRPIVAEGEVTRRPRQTVKRWLVSGGGIVYPRANEFGEERLKMGDLLIIIGFMVLGTILSFVCAEIEWRAHGKPKGGS